jgi:tetratricopeptide (TPR) repeat protein
VAGYRKTRKQRELELKKDPVREKAVGFLENVGKKLEGKGRVILYGLAGLVVVVAAVMFLMNRSDKKSQEASNALGKAIEIAQAQVTSTPTPGSTELTFPNEKERAQKAIEAFDKVINSYGDPYRENARYLKANQLLILDRPKGLSELETLTKSSDAKIAILSKLALAQAKEADNQLDAAAAIYNELANSNNGIIPQDTAKVYLAGVLEKQGKKPEAVEILFNIVKAAREAKDTDGKPAEQSSAARDAADKLQKLDPVRFEQLPAEPPPDLNG